MTKFIPWDSQPLDAWAAQHARGKLIDLDGLQTHYLEKGQGEPVILIHGFYFDTHMWDDNLDALAQHYKVYVLDLWGFGYSTRAPLDYSYPLYARQLELFMDALGLPKATLIGQSMGGGTIVRFCVERGDRVEKVVLVDPAVLPTEISLMGKIVNLPGVGDFLFGLNSNFMRKFTLRSNFIYNHQVITPAFFERTMRFHKVEATTAAMLEILRRQFFFTLGQEALRMGAMKIPTLIVGGRQSALVPTAQTQQLHGILGGSQLVVLDQTGHCPNLERPEEFNRLVLQFLEN